MSVYKHLANPHATLKFLSEQCREISVKGSPDGRDIRRMADALSVLLQVEHDRTPDVPDYVIDAGPPPEPAKPDTEVAAVLAKFANRDHETTCIYIGGLHRRRCTNAARYVAQDGNYVCGLCTLEYGMISVRISDFAELVSLVAAERRRLADRDPIADATRCVTFSQVARTLLRWCVVILRSPEHRDTPFASRLRELVGRVER